MEKQKNKGRDCKIKYFKTRADTWIRALSLSAAPPLNPTLINVNLVLFGETVTFNIYLLFQFFMRIFQLPKVLN